MVLNPKNFNEIEAVFYEQYFARNRKGIKQENLILRIKKLLGIDNEPKGRENVDSLKTAHIYWTHKTPSISGHLSVIVFTQR